MRSAAGSDAGPRTPRIVGLSPLLRPLEALGALGTLMEHAAASTRGRASRRAWVGHGRAHIEVRGLHRPGSEDLAASLKEALEHVRPVRGVEVNAALGRVVVAFDGEEVGLEGLVEVIEEVEELHRVHRERFPHDRPEHPADLEPLQRNLAAMVANPADLEQPRAETPAYNPRRDIAFDRYRKGLPTTTVYPEAEKAKLSDTGK